MKKSRKKILTNTSNSHAKSHAKSRKHHASHHKKSHAKSRKHHVKHHKKSHKKSRKHHVSHHKKSHKKSRKHHASHHTSHHKKSHKKSHATHHAKSKYLRYKMLSSVNVVDDADEFHDNEATDAIKDIMHNIKQDREKAAQLLRQVSTVKNKSKQEQLLNNIDNIYTNILNTIDDPESLLSLAHLRLVYANRPEDAMNLYNQLLEVEPDNKTALFYTAWLPYKLNHNDKNRANMNLYKYMTVAKAKIAPDAIMFLLNHANNTLQSFPNETLEFLYTIKDILSLQLFKHDSNIKLMLSDVNKHITALHEFIENNDLEVLGHEKENSHVFNPVSNEFIENNDLEVLDNEDNEDDI